MALRRQPIRRAPARPRKGPHGKRDDRDAVDRRQVNVLVTGGIWLKTVVFITCDDWGGWYDHVNPPKVETWTRPDPQPSYKGTQFRYGSRVGCIVMSPYARQGYVSKTLHSHVSLVKFCESIFGLSPLNNRDRNAD